MAEYAQILNTLNRPTAFQNTALYSGNCFDANHFQNPSSSASKKCRLNRRKVDRQMDRQTRIGIDRHKERCIYLKSSRELHTTLQT